MYEENNWSFGNGVSNVFDEHVRNSVPLYDLFQEEISNMSVYFSQKNTQIVDIGTSTGNLIAKLFNNNNHRNINFVGIDIEEEMIEECKKRYHDINFMVMDAVEFNYENSSVITCMLSLQFIEKHDRIKLLNKIYNQMNIGGCLFIVEKVRTPNVEIHDIYNDLYYDFKRNSFNGEEILNKNKSLRGVMKPLTLCDNFEILKNAGFEHIDVFMKINNFAGIMAIK